MHDSVEVQILSDQTILGRFPLTSLAFCLLLDVHLIADACELLAYSLVAFIVELQVCFALVQGRF